jgi:hypothetical protein
VYAATNISGYYVRPEYSAEGKITGCQINYCTSLNFGGSLPAPLVNKGLPNSAVEQVQGLIDYVRKEQASK